MTTNKQWIVWVGLAMVMIVMLACAIGGGGVVGNLDSVRDAVVQIEAQGSFVDPEVGQLYNVPGRGSGFIIDPSGIVVTNAHVVNGAALVRVWIGGEAAGEMRNAEVLGISECSDLAVLDIEGEGYPYLEWYSGDITVGMDVYAAGFPLGEPEFTLTRGIVSKESANGDTSWTSVDQVLMHDATLNPGNSGGALVTPDGQVVGVNYSGWLEANQYFAISAQEALPVVERLRGGEDYLSIGVNGSAILTETLSGIWVSSVRSGSPADAAGLEGGDIIVTIEDLILGTDGTMADYCDILETHGTEATMNIQVLRFSEEALYEGQLNGRELALAGQLGGGQTGSGQAGTVTLRMINSSWTDICYVYISLSTESSWGNDWMGSTETIPIGGSRDFSVTAGTWDVAAADCNQQIIEQQMGVPISSDVTWTVVGQSTGSQGGSSGEQAGGVTLRVANNTSSPICYLYFSLSSDPEWGPSWLASGQTIPSGGSQDFSLYPETWDFRAEDCSQQELETQANRELSYSNIVWTVGP